MSDFYDSSLLQITDSIVDYSVVIIMAVFIFASLSWVLSARHWFNGPVRNIDDSDTPSSGVSHSIDEKDEGKSSVVATAIELQP